MFYQIINSVSLETQINSNKDRNKIKHTILRIEKKKNLILNLRSLTGDLLFLKFK